MWLLRTDRAELHYFQNNYDATGGYAILSHTWSQDKLKPEQTLQEVRAIGERCQASGTNPRDDPALSEKIRQCCIIAEKYGYRWVWIDSCCIDKTSSSELSEAINSMFRWYKEAEVCFAYLADVPADWDLHARHSAFRKSRWHTRGWTLQELIAPDFLIFLSTDWHELGNRADVAPLLRKITGIPTGILTGEHQLANFSVSTRMSWASTRQTTRVEDEAYCLMGLFGVSMPTNYGEGKKAFTRLQYEIIQRNPDMSLFAFGHCVNQDQNVTVIPKEIPTSNWRYLLADSPREFSLGGAVHIPDFGANAKHPYPPLTRDQESTGLFAGRVELPRMAVTSYGVKLRVPIYEADGITMAVILCERNGRHLGLFLTRDTSWKDPQRPRYSSGCVYTKPDTSSVTSFARLADLGDDLYKLTFNGKKVEASWRTIYIVATISEFDTMNSTTPKLMLNCNPTSQFRIPRWLVARFTALQFTFRQVRKFKTKALQSLDIALDGVVQIHVYFGVCMHPGEGSPSPDNAPRPWAKVNVSLHSLQMHSFTHDCSDDHLESQSWMTGSKLFGDADRGVRLSLIPSTRMPDSSEWSFVIHLELIGRILGEMFKGPGGISMFPPLSDLEKDTLCPTPNMGPAPSSPSPLQLQPTQSTPSRSSSGPSTATLDRWFTSVPRPVRQRRPPALDLESKLRTLTLNPPTPGSPEQTPTAANEVGSSMAARLDDECYQQVTQAMSV